MKIREQIMLFLNKRFIRIAIKKLMNKDKHPQMGYSLCFMYCGSFKSDKLQLKTDFKLFYEHLKKYSIYRGDLVLLEYNDKPFDNAELRLNIIHDFLKQYPQYKPKNYAN